MMSWVLIEAACSCARWARSPIGPWIGQVSIQGPLSPKPGGGQGERNWGSMSGLELGLEHGVGLGLGLGHGLGSTL